MPIINRLYFSLRHHLIANLPRLYCFFESRKSFVKFFFAGCFSAGVDLVFLYLFHGIIKMEIVISTTIAFVLSFIVSFTLQKFWTFRNYSQDGAPRQFVLYLSSAFIAMNLNGFLMHLLVNNYEVWYMFAQVFVNFTIGLMNFLVYKFIIFKDKEHEAYC